MREVSRVLTAVVALSVGLSACGDDAGPSDPVDEPSAERDASANAKHDASTRDAARAQDGSTSSKPNDEDADVVEEPDAAVEEDAATPAPGKDASVGKDAGVPKDAGAAADAGNGGSDAGTSVCDQLTYATFGQQFMNNYCTSCHGGLIAQKNIHLDTLAGITSAKAKVKSEVSSNSMPPFGSKAPSSAERKQLGQWIDCGPK